jgi:hypothetical protein
MAKTARWRGKIVHGKVLQNGGILQQAVGENGLDCRHIFDCRAAKVGFILPHCAPFRTTSPLGQRASRKGALLLWYVAQWATTRRADASKLFEVSMCDIL